MLCMRSPAVSVTRCILEKREEMLAERLKEHQYAVKRKDLKNGIAAHTCQQLHQVDWSAAKVRCTEQHHWKRKVLEAIHIQQQENTSNLDCGLHISPLWLPVIKKPPEVLHLSTSSLCIYSSPPFYYLPSTTYALYTVFQYFTTSPFRSRQHTRVMLLLFGHLCFQSQVVLTADEGLRVETFSFTKCFFMLR